MDPQKSETNNNENNNINTQSLPHPWIGYLFLWSSLVKRLGSDTVRYGNFTLAVVVYIWKVPGEFPTATDMILTGHLLSSYERILLVLLLRIICTVTSSVSVRFDSLSFPFRSIPQISSP